MQDGPEPQSAGAATAEGPGPVRWGVIGTGIIAGDFVRGLRGTTRGTVARVVGSRPGRGEAFAAQWGLDPAACTDTLDQALSRDDVDAVYIATPHPSHEQIALACIDAGRAVLVEKPIALDHASARRIVDAARAKGVFLMEAYMYRCHPVIAELVALIRGGAIGAVQRIESSFCFYFPFDAEHRLFNPALGGGAILDVGGYPVSLSGLVAGCATGATYARPRSITATGILGQTGVEEDARAELTYDNHITAVVRCSVREDAGLGTTVFGERGSITLPDAWLPGSDRHGLVSPITIQRDGRPAETRDVAARAAVYALEAEAVADALGRRSLEPAYPALGWDDTLANMRVIEAWRTLVAQGGGTEDALF